MRARLLLLAGVAMAGCERPGDGLPDDTADSADSGIDTDADCTLGLPCHPIPVADFPYVDRRDTALAPDAAVDHYACSPDTDESGPEWFYAIALPTAGVVSARLVDGAGVDVDLHLLADVDAASCLVRHDTELAWFVAAGTAILVADTWVDGDGVALAGEYTLTIDFVPLTGTSCALVDQDLRMFWSECAPGIDCSESAGDVLLHLPAWGPVVQEAHLVTVGDDFGGGWPASFTDQIARHYALSEASSGFVTSRDQPWAPAGEGGSEYGQGSTGAPLPVDAEAWYVNMHWRDRPAKGTPMLVLEPFTGKAVVAAAGYETGPGANTAIGGAVEEIHHHLGTGHRDRLIMGFLEDDTLPFGPIDCQ